MGKLNGKTDCRIFAITANHDTGVVAYTNSSGNPDTFDQSNVFCINEERLSRKKLTREFPKRSIRSAWLAHNNTAKLQTVLIASRFTPIFLIRIMNPFYSQLKLDNPFNPLISAYVNYHRLLLSFPFLEKLEVLLNKMWYSWALPVGIKNIHLLEHHQCHAASAYYPSGFREALVITMDMMGDGISITVSAGNGRELKRVFMQEGNNGIGAFYGKVTSILGFVATKDEGKITGLAAYGKIHHSLLEHLRSIASFDRTVGGFTKLRFLDKRASSLKYQELKKYTKEDCAATCQYHFEKEIAQFVEYWVKKTAIKNVCLAGGIFGNVKLNQRIHELPCVDNVFVFPHMGDGGLAFGALMAHLRPRPFDLKSVHLGPEFTNGEIKKALVQHGVSGRFYRNIEEKVADLLSQGNIVARFCGKMEFGPRALGNRSVLYQACDKDAKKRLNTCLDRTEFMPFAPAVMDKHAKRCFEGTKGAEKSLKWMTMTLPCTTYMKKTCPGAVHIDGTARPQVVKKKDNPSFSKILEQYHRKTKIPAIINTSFNMHNEPIVCTPQDAIEAFQRSGIDHLAIGNYLIGKEDCKQSAARNSADEEE